MKRAWGWLLQLLVLLLAAPAWADDDFLDHYKAGLTALERQDWTVAALRMRQALEGKREEVARLPRRLYLKRYLPHYQLGRALFESGDCSGAVSAWEESERQGIVRQFEENRQLTRNLETCRQRLVVAAELTSTLSIARQRLAAAEDAARRVSQASQSPELAAGWTTGEPSLAGRESSAKQLLTSARAKLPDKATAADLPRIRESSDLSSQALARFEEIERESRNLPSAAATEQAEQRSGLEGQIKVALALLGGHRFLEPYPPEVARRRQELETEVAAAQSLSTSPDAKRVAEVSENLLAAQNRLKKAIAPPPEALSRAAKAYFSGDYQATLDLLENARLPDQRAVAHAALFRAAARFGIWATGGEKDSALLAAARADIQACREADSTRIPATTAFSPRFVEFFTRESSSATP